MTTLSATMMSRCADTCCCSSAVGCSARRCQPARAAFNAPKLASKKLAPVSGQRAKQLRMVAGATNGATSLAPTMEELAALIQDPEVAELIAKRRAGMQVPYLYTRTNAIRQHFPTALPVDDFLHRLEIALFAYGFTGDNSIACTNLCRDEITATVKSKIDDVFGAAFNTNGLGGVLTCGVTGIKAGLSHAPNACLSGKERYVFFSMPHISVDSSGKVGDISRPGRGGSSCACGALIACLGMLHSGGVESCAKPPGVHDYDDPELSILKQRLARRIKFEAMDEAQVKAMDLVGITKVAERTIHDDMDYLIKHAVDEKKADYAVITGVQVHNWSTDFDNDTPNLEFVAPVEVYVVVNGEKTYVELDGIPSMTPRQVSLLASATGHPPSAPDPYVKLPSKASQLTRVV